MSRIAILKLATVLLIVLGAFYLGTVLGSARAKAMATASRRQAVAIQEALDLMTGFQGTNHVGPAPGLGREFSRAVTDALLGQNPSLSSSNSRMLYVAPDQVRGGVLVDYFGAPYRFLYVRLNSSDLQPYRIVVCGTVSSGD